MPYDDEFYIQYTLRHSPAWYRHATEYYWGSDDDDDDDDDDYEDHMFSRMLAHGHFTPLGSGHFPDATVPRPDAQPPSDPTDYYTFEDLEAEAASTAPFSISEADVCENADVATCPPCQDLEAVNWKPSLFFPPRDQGSLAAERRPEGGRETAQTAATPSHTQTHTRRRTRTLSRACTLTHTIAHHERTLEQSWPFRPGAGGTLRCPA